MGYESVQYRKQLEARGDLREQLSVDEGIVRLKSMAGVKGDRSYKNGRKRKSTDSTVEIAIHLGIDARQADQMLRGAISLPKGLGKTRKVIAFCDGDAAEAAKAAGASEVGGDELVKKVQDGLDRLRCGCRTSFNDGQSREIGPRARTPGEKCPRPSPER